MSKFKWTHELELDFWEMVDIYGTDANKIFNNMKNKIVSLQQVKNHLKSVINLKSLDKKCIQTVKFDNEKYIFLVMDVETTGLSSGSQIIMISFVCNDKNIDDYTIYINPTRNVQRKATDVNQLSTKKDIDNNYHLYKNKRPIDKVKNRVEGFVDFLNKLNFIIQYSTNLDKKLCICTHNGFKADFVWLLRELNILEIDYMSTLCNVYLIDSLIWIKKLNQIENMQLTSFNNVNLYKHFFNIEFAEHDAYEDAKATYCWLFNSTLNNSLSSLDNEIVSFPYFYNKFCSNEKILYNRKNITNHIEDKNILSYGTVRKIATIHTDKNISKIKLTSDNDEIFHNNLNETIKVNKNTSYKLYNNFEEYTPWICPYCNKRMKLLTSKKPKTYGRQFYLCFDDKFYKFKDIGNKNRLSSVSIKHLEKKILYKEFVSIHMNEEKNKYNMVLKKIVDILRTF
jgi:hypothetical protein